MATRTYSSSGAPAQPKVKVGALVTRIMSWGTTLSQSAGDIMILKDMPIPHGAEITSVVFGGVQETTSTTSVSLVFTLGLNYNGSVDYRTIWARTTVISQAAWVSVDYAIGSGNTAGATTPWPVTVSVSDDYQPRYVYPMVTVASGTQGSATGSLTVRLSCAITYTMDR